jgi:hypothetical protein
MTELWASYLTPQPKAAMNKNSEAQLLLDIPYPFGVTFLPYQTRTKDSRITVDAVANETGELELGAELRRRDIPLTRCIK